MGIKSRQMFGFMANPCDELVPIYLASICMACPIIPFLRSFSIEEIATILKDTKPVAMFCDANAYHYIKGILTELNWNMKVFTFDGSIDGTEPVSNLLRATGEDENFL